MKYNKIFLVSLAILAIFMLGAVSATDDISVDNSTVEENTLNSIEEVSDEVELGENEENDLLESTYSEDVASEKESLSMDVKIWWDSEIGGVIDEFPPGYSSDKYVKVSLPKKVNGTLSLYMDGKFISDKNITAKTHYFNVTVDDIGKHIAEVKYSGDDQYSASSASTTFEVVSCYIDCTMDIVYSASNEYLGVYVSGPTNNPNPNGDIVVIINGKRYVAPIIRGNAFIKLESLDLGHHNVHIDYLGDNKHAPRSLDTIVNVYPEISMNNDIAFNENNEVYLELPADAKGHLVVKVEGNVVGDVPLVNGYASVSLNDFRKFNQELEIEMEYTSDDYDVDSVDIYFRVNPQIDLERDMIINQKYTLAFTLPNTYSGDLELEVPGYDENLKAKVIKGKASIDFLAKEIGDNLIFLTYNDDSGADYSEIYSIFVGPNPNMVATIDSKAGNDPVVKVNVANDAGGAISVIVNGNEYSSSYFTKNGSLTILGLADGTYTAIVTYSGDYKYPTVSKTITFTKTSKNTPTKKADKISLKLAKVTVKKSAKKLVIKATLKINGKVVKGKKITFKFNKKTYKAKTNKKGVAKITIKKSVLKKLKVGKKVKYQASYGKTTVKKTVKVKK